MSDLDVFRGHRSGYHALNIKIDHREHGSGIREILTQQYDVVLIAEHLKTGDYLINDEIVVERKTTFDFVQSIIDGRLFRQTAAMKRLFDCAAIIVEGKNLYDTSIDIHPHAVKGALISTALWQMPVLFAEDKEDTALFLWLLGTQNTKTRLELSYRPGRRPKQFRKRQLYILQGLPHVGPRLASQLLDHFGCVEKAVAASEEALMRIPRLGKVKARKIRDAVSKSF